MGILDRDETLRDWGYTPIKSTASGAFRVAKSIPSIFFDVIVIPIADIGGFGWELKNKNTKRAFTNLLVRAPVGLLRSLSVNVANIARGIIEMVPDVGNLAAWGFDKLSYKYRKWQNGILSLEELQKARLKGQEVANKMIEKLDLCHEQQEAMAKKMKEEREVAGKKMLEGIKARTEQEEENLKNIGIQTSGLLFSTQETPSVNESPKTNEEGQPPFS